MKQVQFPFLFFLIFFFHCSTTPAQSQAPAPSGPTNITAILEKAGQFTTFIQLLKSTQEADQINTQLNNSNQGLTIFAPTDSAFSNLKSGTLNSLTDQQKVQIVQFHILPSFFSISQFQTASNPLHTQAGNSDNGQFPLNVTTSGNQVNVTTGVVHATVANSLYTDNQLAIYQVDQVLRPLAIFGTAASPAPTPSSKPKKRAVSGSDAPSGGSSDDASVDTFGAMAPNHPPIAAISVGVAVSAAFCSLWL